MLEYHKKHNDTLIVARFRQDRCMSVVCLAYLLIIPLLKRRKYSIHAGFSVIYQLVAELIAVWISAHKADYRFLSLGLFSTT